MRFVFAPDSFKGSLSSVRLCEILTDAARRRFPDAECVSIPAADGGEGTLDALLAAQGGERISETVTSPTGDMVSAQMARLSNGAYLIEMAQCCGLPLVKPENRNPLYLTSYGLGEMLARALDRGAEEIYVGIGGSATNDGGMGLLSALGAVFTAAGGRRLDGIGMELKQVEDIDLSNLHPGLARARITVISDVTNPLLGKDGATYVYGPQKGADAETLRRLEAGMTHYADRFYDLFGLDIASFPGAGAAGGCGAALAGVLRADLRRGIDTVLDLCGFDALVPGCSLVVTGEGRVDGQTAKYGKVPAGVLARCGDVPCAVLTGCVGPEAGRLLAMGNCMIFPIADRPMTLEYAMEHAEALAASAADRLFWALGAFR